MIKTDLISKISIKRGLTLEEAKEIVELFIDIFKEAIENGEEIELRGFGSFRIRIENGEEIELRGFGSFRIRDRKSRPGRNPKTGETFPIPDKKIVKFKPSINLEIKE